ncbi:multicopper oxidase domain-containing protein [Trueperella sp.]|uniref:multicopper oxidase domain-containing protein n=1 Tax=Trueperella sp. TaxID=2699835 RepID=UPI0022EADC10|nr:multicopper oxidase domain-containing protein [Trueperella sp.]
MNEVKPPSIWSGISIVAALCAILLAVTIGVIWNPSAANLPARDLGGVQPSQTGVVEPTGETTEVMIVANHDMSFTPNRIEVPAGNRLVVTLENRDALNGHDLVIGEYETGRVQPGETAVLDAGVITESIQGYCSVAGHKQMGMTIDIVVIEPAAGTSDGGPGSAPHAEHTGNVAIPDGDGEINEPISAELPALETDEGPVTHEVTLTVTEVPLEVAPGLYQTRWTFNGNGVGPTLHGRVGDTFNVTLINDGTIGHSIDFHAGALAPDEPMRTIAPGEKLVYTFTATRAGIWMYHCSTAPMSTHIAAGMHGAVVIEPEGLEPVDKQFVLVQSEVYLASAAHSAAEAEELDADKIAAGTPDRVVFNGIANQYDQEMFEVVTDERVRFWVLDAGPNVPLSFHIVGGQFDTLWTEGAYHIKQGASAWGSDDGGAQVLSLLPAEGGFVELTFPEAGHYSVVNHIMSEAERGAHGIVKVTDPTK